LGGISFTRVKYVGSHAGVSIGEDGPSQMELEDFAFFRTIPNIVCFYPSDAVSAKRAVELAANYEGACYIRTSRSNFPILYKNVEVFDIGKAKILVESSDDVWTIVAGGVTVHEAMKAAEKIKDLGKAVRIIDLFTVKSVDRDTILESVKATNNRLIVVEDHYREDGLGEAVMAALADQTDIKIVRLAVQEVPHSGTPEQLLSKYGIDAEHIVNAVEKLV
jgi:transketolase